MLIALRAGDDVETCPRCGAAMSQPIRGRRSGEWYRQCQNPDGCLVATRSPVPPPAVVTTRGPIGAQRPVEVELPFVKGDPVAHRALVLKLFGS